MDRILVEVYVPAAEKTFDVYIPRHPKMRDVTTLLSRIFSELLEGHFIATPDTALYDRTRGEALDIKLSAAQCDLKNGARLMLI